MLGLAQVLLEISYEFDNDSESEDYIYFEEVSDFIDKVQNFGLIPVCPDFIEEYKLFANEVVEGEGDR